MHRVTIKPVRKERRKHPRLPISIPIFVRGTDGGGKKFLEFATAVNISAGGALLVIRRSLPETSAISLEVPVAPLTPPQVVTRTVRSLSARMVRVTHGERCHLVALKFLRPLQA